MLIYCICTQYLVGAHFALITASIQRVMEVISLWLCWGAMPRFLWQWPSAHLHFLVSCFSFFSWQYPIDSLWGSGLVSFLVSQAHQHHDHLTNFWCFWQWPRELNSLQIERAATSSIWPHTRCKCSQHNQKKKRAANRKNTCKLRKQLPQFDYTQAANAHSTTKQRNALQIKCICLCCEHFHQLLSKWWKCFLDLQALFLFACVFWSCSALSSLATVLLAVCAGTTSCWKMKSASLKSWSAEGSMKCSKMYW